MIGVHTSAGTSRRGIILPKIDIYEQSKGRGVGFTHVNMHLCLRPRHLYVPVRRFSCSEFINAYCSRRSGENCIAMRERFSPALGLNIGFSKKSIKGAWSLKWINILSPWSYFKTFSFLPSAPPFHYLQRCAGTQTHTHTRARALVLCLIWSPKRGAKKKKLPITQRQLY